MFRKVSNEIILFLFVKLKDVKDPNCFATFSWKKVSLEEEASYVA
jgi:hypothetical protein